MSKQSDKDLDATEYAAGNLRAYIAELEADIDRLNDELNDARGEIADLSDKLREVGAG